MRKIMKSLMVAIVYAICLFLTVCSNHMPGVESSIVFKKGGDALLRPQEGAFKPEQDAVVFSGGDILWLNGTTGELKFRDEKKMAELLHANHRNGLAVYLQEEYLFPVFIPDPISSTFVFEPLVMVYDVTVEPVIEGDKPDELDTGKPYPWKYNTTYSFRLEGYPWADSCKGQVVVPQTDDGFFEEAYRKYMEKWSQMEPGWQRFIAQLKAEGRYRE